MTKALDDLIAGLRANPKNVRFADLLKVCRVIFGEQRVSGSHHVFKMQWPVTLVSTFKTLVAKRKRIKLSK